MNRKMYYIFENWSERKQLITGLLITVLGSLLGVLFHVRYVTLMNLTPYLADLPIYAPLVDNLINILTLTLCLFLFGKLLNVRTRFIDIFCLSMIWRAPFYLGSLLNIDGFLSKQVGELAGQVTTGSLSTSTFSLVAFLLVALVAITLLTLSVWLLYAGFHTATNGKKSKQIIFFIIALFIALILTQIIFLHFNHLLSYSV